MEDDVPLSDVEEQVLRAIDTRNGLSCEGGQGTGGYKVPSTIDLAEDVFNDAVHSLKTHDYIKFTDRWVPAAERPTPQDVINSTKSPEGNWTTSRIGSGNVLKRTPKGDAKIRRLDQERSKPVNLYEKVKTYCLSKPWFVSIAIVLFIIATLAGVIGYWATIHDFVIGKEKPQPIVIQNNIQPQPPPHTPPHLVATQEQFEPVAPNTLCSVDFLNEGGMEALVTKIDLKQGKEMPFTKSTIGKTEYPPIYFQNMNEATKTYTHHPNKRIPIAPKENLCLRIAILDPSRAGKHYEGTIIVSYADKTAIAKVIVAVVKKELKDDADTSPLPQVSVSDPLKIRVAPVPRPANHKTRNDPAHKGDDLGEEDVSTFRVTFVNESPSPTEIESAEMVVQSSELFDNVSSTLAILKNPLNRASHIKVEIENPSLCKAGCSIPIDFAAVASKQAKDFVLWCPHTFKHSAAVLKLKAFIRANIKGGGRVDSEPFDIVLHGDVNPNEPLPE